MLAHVVLIQRDIGGLDGQLAAVGHGVASVHGEVQDHLFDLAGIGFDPAQFLRVDRLQFNILADEAAQHLLQVGNHGVQIQHQRLQHLFAAERQQLAGERCRPVPALLISST